MPERCTIDQKFKVKSFRCHTRDELIKAMDRFRPPNSEFLPRLPSFDCIDGVGGQHHHSTTYNRPFILFLTICLAGSKQTLVTSTQQLKILETWEGLHGLPERRNSSQYSKPLSKFHLLRSVTVVIFYATVPNQGDPIITTGTTIVNSLELLLLSIGNGERALDNSKATLKKQQKWSSSPVNFMIYKSEGRHGCA